VADPGVRIRVAACLRRGDDILLVQHEKRAAWYWLLPGGGLDYGETLTEATRREAREETGFEIEVGRLIIVCEAIEPGGRHIVNLVFTGEITGGELAVGQNDKSLRDAAWQPRSALTRLPMFPPIGEVIEESWQEDFKGEVKVLGNVWKPLMRGDTPRKPPSDLSL
jgi:ADP-ribose pyrophosphatase YjhB (NUDIX family)